jgi:ubiquinone/menaquinone biosynthesis C-methylase UbiE
MEIDLLGTYSEKRKPMKTRMKASQTDRILTWKIDKEFWDGKREQGYGGYKYDGRWKPIAKNFIKHYKLNKNSKILEIGCAKGFFLKEFYDLLKNKENVGIDISSYAIVNSHKKVKENLIIGNMKQLPFENKYFDLVICVHSLHSILDINEVTETLKEMSRVVKDKKNIFIMVGAFSNTKERKNLDNWGVLTATYLHVNDWLKLFKKTGYKGDYSWYKPK